MIKNQIKTVLLLGALTGIFLLIGSLIGGRTGLTIAFFFALLMNFGSYWFSDKLVLAMYRAKEISKKENSKLHEIVEEICKEAKIPKPKIYLIPSDASNAFATGRNAKHSAVAVTQGILDLLNKDELKGVIAHEISHIKNRDILIATIAATIASVISYLAFMARYAAIFGGTGKDRESGSNILELLVLAIIAPIAALVIQLAISRSREFIADETGAKLIHTGLPLANALEKLHQDVKSHPLRFGNQATSSLFIINPFSGRSLMSLFSTHPDYKKRIEKLRDIQL